MFDNELRLQDSALKNGTGYGTIGGVAQTRELGNGHVTGRFIVRVDALKTVDANERYILALEGGDCAAFTNNTELARIEVGCSASFDDGNVNRGTGMYAVPFSNRVGNRQGTVYPWVRVRHILSGTVPEITYRAVLGRLP